MATAITLLRRARGNPEYKRYAGKLRGLAFVTAVAAAPGVFGGSPAFAQCASRPTGNPAGNDNHAYRQWNCFHHGF